MIEQGWEKFLAAEGVEDWVVLHGGATAVFRVPSLGEAAQLAEAIANVPGLEGSGTLLTITDDHLSVRLTRGVFRLKERHIDLARAVSQTARERCHRRPYSGARGPAGDSREARFDRRRLLARRTQVRDASRGQRRRPARPRLDRLDAGAHPDKPLRHAMHVDVPVAREHAEARVAAALAAGGRIVDDTDAPAGWILSDRAGNRVCVAAWPDGSVPPAPADPQ